MLAQFNRPEHTICYKFGYNRRLIAVPALARCLTSKFAQLKGRSCLFPEGNNQQVDAKYEGKGFCGSERLDH